MDQSLIASIQRILVEDRAAVWITGGFVLIQMIIFLHVVWLTWHPLRGASSRLRIIAAALNNTSGEGTQDDQDGNATAAAEDRVVGRDSKVLRAWNLSVKAQRASADPSGVLEPEIAFEASRLLPSNYNPRLDSAAPGLFTALGIMGTFVGLIIGFLQVNPAQASASVGPLIGGMVVAFVNSLLGVFLSIQWAYWSRRIRHGFDSASFDLLVEAELRFHRSGVGDLLRGVREEIHQLRMETEKSSRDLREASERSSRDLREANEKSSRELLDGLSPRMADSMKVLVTAPFEQLTESVREFDGIVREAGARQAAIAEELQNSTTALASAKKELAESLVAATSCVGAFSSTTAQMQEASRSTAEIVGKTAGAAAELGTMTSELRETLEVHKALGVALTSTTATLGDTNEAIQVHAAQFRSSTEHLEQSVSTLSAVAATTAERAGDAVNAELEAAIGNLIEGIKSAGEQTAAAHIEGSERIISSVNAGVTEVTERLSQDLNGIARELPDQLKALNRSMHETHTSTVQASADATDRIIATLDTAASALTEQIAAQLGSVLEEWPRQVTNLSAAMEESHGRTISTYQASTEQLVEVIDRRVSDLTDGMTAELATLANRIPSEVRALNESMSQIRAQIQKATRSMDGAVQQLAVHTPQHLQAHLKAYDEALAGAMDRFSGTLATWNRCISEIQTYSNAMQELAEIAAKRVRVPRVAKIGPS